MLLASGFAGTTMDAVAKGAGVSKASLYALFPSKDDLYRAVVLDWVKRGSDAMRPFVDALLAPAGLRKSLLGLARTMQSGMLAPDVLAMRSLVMGEASRHPDIAAGYVASSWERNTAMLSAALAELDRRGTMAISDCDVAAQQFTWLTVGQALNQHDLTAGALRMKKKALERTAAAAVETFLGAYGGR